MPWFSDYDHRDYSYDSKSGSRGWRSKFFSRWEQEEVTDDKSVLQDLLNQLQNSANIIGGDDNRVSVRWSNGSDVNRIEGESSRTIFLSPDELVSSDSRKVSDDVLDAMTGKVYLASTLRETVDPEAYLLAQAWRSHGKDPVSKNSVSLWESLETSIARSKILEDWAGFAPYIAEDARKSAATKKQVQGFIDESVMAPNIDAVTTALSWNILNPNDHVEIPNCYEECIKIADEVMANDFAANERFDVCNSLVSRMNEVLKQENDGEGNDQDESESRSGEDDSDKSKGGKDGKDDSDKGKDRKGKDGKGKDGKGDTPKVCDGSLLGDKVENKTDKTLSEQEASDPSKSDEEKGEIRVSAPSGMDDMGKNVRVVKESGKGMASPYSEIVSQHKKEIASIRSSLMFRKTQATMVSYGHRSGDIDENSLFKVRMDDDRVMTRTDSIDSKRIAICLLVDESGSMNCSEYGKTYYEQARNVAIVLAEGLKGMDGIDVCIYGHTAEDGFRGVTLREYYSPRQRNLPSLMKICGRNENHDSWAILHTANIFNRDYGDADRKIVFVISDGEPAGSRYGGHLARKHMLDVNNSCLKKGVEVYGVGIAEAFSKETGDEMYGEGRCVILRDVKSSLGIIGRFIRQIANKQGVR